MAGEFIGRASSGRSVRTMPSENTTDRKERELRDLLWPEAATWIWDRKDKQNKGFATIPRLLPMIMILIEELSAAGEGDARLVYLELWSRTWDSHMISISDEEEIAFSSNCTNPKRAIRTWKDHVKVLRRLGFILTAADGNREIGHILLLNPLAVAARLRSENKISDRWWSAFTRRAVDIGTKIPNPNILPPLENS